MSNSIEMVFIHSFLAIGNDNKLSILTSVSVFFFYCILKNESLQRTQYLCRSREILIAYYARR